MSPKFFNRYFICPKYVKNSTKTFVCKHLGTVCDGASELRGITLNWF